MQSGCRREPLESSSTPSVARKSCSVTAGAAEDRAPARAEPASKTSAARSGGLRFVVFVVFVVGLGRARSRIDGVGGGAAVGDRVTEGEP